MNNRWRYSARRRAFATILALAFVGGLGADHAASAIEAGAAKVAITPPVGTPLNGYGARLGRESRDVHDPLWVRCLYLDDGKTEVFLLSADLCLINPELRERIHQLAATSLRDGSSTETDRPRFIILTATHTHSGQGGMISALPFRAVSGRFMPEVLDATAQAFVQAMQSARASHQRAAVGFAAGVAEGLSVNRQEDGGPVDTQLGVIRVENADGVPIAVVANFAMHPTTIDGPDLFSISADFPGYCCATIETLAGGDTIALFLNGAEGNQGPGNPEAKKGWERTESLGRLLGERTWEVAGSVVCGDAALRVAQAAPSLPRSLADALLPREGILQVLEVEVQSAAPGETAQTPPPETLAVHFLPGEPCVQIGLELRRRAAEWGYAAQFTVGLANDFLGYFAPVDLYGTASYEASMNFFGPHIAQWLYVQLALLTSRAPHGEDEEAEAEEPPAVETHNGARWVTLRGTDFAMGAQRALAFRDEMERAYKDRVVASIAEAKMIPETGLGRFLGRYLDPTPLLLPASAIKARPRLYGVSQHVIDGLAGQAEVLGLPFDALWLLESAQPSAPAAGPLAGTLFAALGERAGADDLLVGFNSAANGLGAMLVTDVAPKEGHRFVAVSSTTSMGTFAGMNDSGLVLCAAPVSTTPVSGIDVPSLAAMLADESEKEPRPVAGPPLGIVLRSILQDTDGLDRALAQIRDIPELAGYHVMLATPAKKTERDRACVLECGPMPQVRLPQNDVLLGVATDASQADPVACARHRRVAELLEEEHIISAAELERALRDTEPLMADSTRVWSEQTDFGVVFLPSRRLVRIGFAGEDGVPGEFFEIHVDSASEGENE
ncbi:MAG TPA: neutral/alkaline non-lysosomal ceramidase N-terminal domain-containing protein [Candidatus Hydrogenedentes bacterium]|nr:neutral/alkaline non-lysosomal ceramidase N-terminal domain-containing protein [Candidatus Hydrogenedentota bacterium]HPG68512.1 neutral/alkaline non-lysosomal ceramidase N-terminal domain-containing protein [Candidatus Hydrogenedentota bacterium]